MEKILLSHGSGGRVMHKLISDLFITNFSNPVLDKLNDQAIINLESNKIAFTTDSYVVDPLFFPGGDIGELAVYGTVNDLSVGGAVPLYLSLGFIIEEGFDISDLEKIINSIKNACKRAGVNIVTGDTKIVNKGKTDKIFINTSGIGIIPNGVDCSVEKVKTGDKIILSGTIGEHGMAIMTAREGIEIKNDIKSDCRPLNHLVKEMLKFSKKISCMRDPTRGGLATTLNEIAESAKAGIEIYEEKIPVLEPVKASCEILGLDPLYVANEGKLIAFVDSDIADDMLNIMKNHPDGKDAAIIGEVVESHPKKVILKTLIGGKRIVDMLSGEQLPRIC
jgi:hydrogenase expression/formation protein HypE